jgi:hypothetical protein
LGLGGGGGLDGDELRVWAEGGLDLGEGGGLNVGFEILERWDEKMRGTVGGAKHEGVQDGGIVGVAVGGDLREGRGDEDDVVAELAEALGVGLHGEAGVESEVAFGVAELGPILGGEGIREIVGREEEASAAGGEKEHIDVFNDTAGKRFQIGDGLAAGGFGEFLSDVEILIFVAGEESAGGEAAAVVEFEEITAVEGERGIGEVEVGSGEDGVGDVIGGPVVVGTLGRSFVQELGEFAEYVELVFDGGGDGFASFGSEIGVEGVGVALSLLLAGLEKAEAGGFELLEFFALGCFGANVEVAPVDDLGGVVGRADLWAKVADPDVVVEDDFDADAVGGDEVADLKFRAAVADGFLGGFVGSEEEDGSEGGDRADDVHLDDEEFSLAGDCGGGIGEEIFGEVLLEFGVGSEGLRGEDEDFGRGLRQRKGLRTRGNGEDEQERDQECATSWFAAMERKTRTLESEVCGTPATQGIEA